MHAFAFVSRFCLARQKRLAQTVESRSCVLNKRSVCNGIVTATVRSGNAGLVPGRRRSCHRNSHSAHHPHSGYNFKHLLEMFIVF
jgi:hypothetical protein